MAPYSGSVGLFWTIAGPVGFLLSGFLGWLYSKTRGQVSSREGSFVALHFLGTLVAVALVSGPVWTIVGVVVAASLAATARIGGRRE